MLLGLHVNLTRGGDAEDAEEEHGQEAGELGQTVFLFEVLRLVADVIKSAVDRAGLCFEGRDAPVAVVIALLLVRGAELLRKDRALCDSALLLRFLKAMLELANTEQ